MMRKKYGWIGLVLLCCPYSVIQAKSWNAETVKQIIIRVNDSWQKSHPDPGRSFWDNAVYHTGNMEAYRLVGKKTWLDYSLLWASQNDWQGAREKDPSLWKYKTYGEDQQHVLFGDWQVCFQTYLDLYRERTGSWKLDTGQVSKEIARPLEVMGYEAESQVCDYWWWADALYMVMPVMTRMYLLTGEQKYLDKMYANWQYARSLMYDHKTGLFFRDGKYVYPKHQTARGKKDFWARGNGWVFAALAKVLSDLPQQDVHRKAYLRCFRKMAKAVRDSQQPEGYWTRSMLDPEQAPGRETSGTALFAYGLLWGINNGYLSPQGYGKTAQRAWDYLGQTALQPDATVGYVQPIGEKAIPGQIVDRQSVSNFGTGVFLLAACEYVRYIINHQ